MPVERSAWRAGDSAAYTQMRAIANAVASLLLSTSGPALSEARDVLQDARSVDGFDRAAVDAARERFDERLTELRSADRG